MTSGPPAAGRRGELTRELGGDPPSDVDLPFETDPAVIAQRRELVTMAMSALSPEERLIVQLFVVAGLPATEVARLVSLPNAKAVYNRMYRALFYRRLKESSPAEALARAQGQMITGERYQAPYYWAAYQLVGEGRGGSQ